MPTSPVPCDYHSHHRRCGHAVGELGDYIRAAIDREMVEFGLSDHGPAYWLDGDHALPGTLMATSEFPIYCREAQEMKARFAHRIRVRAGVEADFIEGHESDLAALLDAQPLDYVLGSVHWAAGTSIFNRKRWDTERPVDVFAEYYRLVAAAARSGLFDILSHLTAVEAYAPERESAQAFYGDVADAVADSGCIVEINTSGYRKMGGDEPFPNRALLHRLVARGVPLTFGADSHRPEEVGFGRERVADLLVELGIDPEKGPTPVRVRREPLLAWTR
jgi:histidinol-phosphatase (PHP family)